MAAGAMDKAGCLVEVRLWERRGNDADCRCSQQNGVAADRRVGADCLVLVRSLIKGEIILNAGAPSKAPWLLKYGHG